MNLKPKNTEPENSKKRKDLKISAKMTIFFIVLIIMQGIISLSVLTVIISRTNKDSLKNQTNRTLLGIEGHLRDTVDDLIIKAELLAGQKKTIDYTIFGLRNYLQRQLEPYNNTMRIDSISIFTSPGEVYANTGEKVTSDPVFTELLQKGFSGEKQYAIRNNNDKPGFTVVCPIERESGIIGALVLIKNIDQSFISRLEKILNCRIMFVYNDIIINNYNITEGEVKKIISFNYDYEESKAGQIAEIGNNITGFFPTSKIGAGGGVFYSILNTSEGTAQLKRYSLISILLIIFTISLALVLGIIFYRKTFYEPFQDILKGMKKITTGYLHPPFQILKDNEFGELAGSFNHMCSVLLEREEELSNLSRYNTLIMENISSGIITIDPEEKIVTSNQTAELLLKSDQEFLTGSRVDEQFKSGEFIEIIRDGLKQKKYCPGKEVKITAGDEERIFTVRTSPLLSTEGDEIGLIAIFEDRTHLKALEEKVQISSRLAALGEMAAGVAHQVRNPLAVMKLSVEMLRDEYNNKNKDENYTKLTSMVVDEIDTLNMVVGNFLNFARPRNVNRIPFSIEQIIRASLRAIPLYKYEGIEIDVDIEKNLPPYMIDKDLIIQVISNLLLNAVQASDSGGKVIITANSFQEKIVIQIKDQGVGMTEELKRKIFNPFFSTKDSGSGLGLSIVHRIIENHQGSLEVESAPGKGSIFRMEL